eukprot:gnl/MRDRNA2_/MRDRNA2_55117_c0_seq2.p1 gnl/MRDRNA2_/MRDRNA2_55117_c0~~gnl/MRDRNA2_/MRDRNA2_55117_c0_seq2.p1  ORF type:complete len:210 (-),score=42.60 gnl/MRDRNA2_/MRDRNA2_55117_c0_seq2:131-760(-)
MFSMRSSADDHTLDALATIPPLHASFQAQQYWSHWQKNQSMMLDSVSSSKVKHVELAMGESPLMKRRIQSCSSYASQCSAPEGKGSSSGDAAWHDSDMGPPMARKSFSLPEMTALCESVAEKKQENGRVASQQQRSLWSLSFLDELQAELDDTPSMASFNCMEVDMLQSVDAPLAFHDANKDDGFKIHLARESPEEAENMGNDGPWIGA